ncbi:MAG: DASH family cryptochrome [Halobacteriaceae archaeon]
METAVVWFRSDLRLHDNPTLQAALDDAATVLPVYVHPPERTAAATGMFDLPKTGARRARFRVETVTALRNALETCDSGLVVRTGEPATVLPEIVATVGADAVYAQQLPAPEERERERAVRTALDVPLHTRWTHTLIHRTDLPTPVESIPDTFTPWRKEVEAEAAIRDAVPRPETIPRPAVEPERGSIPSLAELGYDPGAATPDDRGVMAFEGGEASGLSRLHDYVWVGDHLREYKETRNGLLGADFSSKLSPWLAIGALSPRRVSEAIDRYERERVANDSTYWLRFELLWRDFFQFQFAKHGAQFFAPGGIRERNELTWRADEAAFRRWADGRTGIPFVDANMRELRATGYMSNRGRQNAASFLANDLGIDWRRGAALFEARLIDHDVCSNYGNWAYVAGVGNDARDRSFDVLSQARRYDADGRYVRTWVPALAALPAEAIHEPWTLSEAQQEAFDVRLGTDYPRPMTDAYR